MATHRSSRPSRRTAAFRRNAWSLPPPEEVITSRTKLITITNLHNPSCVRTPEAMLRRYGEVARRAGARVLVDEVYLESLYEKMSTAFHYGPEFVVTSSLTKAYGLSGIRCGWILAQPDVAERLWRFRDLIDSSSVQPAELLSVAAFKQLPRIADRAKALLEKNRALVREFVGCSARIECVIPDFGTCVFPRLRDTDADSFVALLHERYETDVVPGRFFDMPSHFRVGLGGDTATLAGGLDRLKTALRDVVE